MDIYEWAQNNDADYYDSSTQRIYKVMDYNFANRNGLPSPGIAVYDYLGKFLGYAEKKDPVTK